MALLNFLKKKKEEKKEKKETKTPALSPLKETEEKKEKKQTPSFKEGNYVKNPHLTEKTNILSGQGIYVFDVGRGANKVNIGREIRELYKVVPEKIRILNFPKKSLFLRGIAGSRGGGRKAFVYLSPEDRGKIKFA